MLCRECNELAVVGRKRCVHHLYGDALRHKRYYARHRLEEINRQRLLREQWRVEGKCVRCGIPLIEGEGIICVNCCIASHGGIR